MTSDEQLGKGRKLRVDAKRNADAVLLAAKKVFLQSGVDAPVRDIATAAGVGVATLYRRYPKHSDLIKAVFQREIDVCAGSAPTLSKHEQPADALRSWLKQYAEFMSTKKGLAAALHSGDDAYKELPEYFKTRFEPALAGLITEAAKAGSLRSEVAPFDLLRAIGNLAMTEGENSVVYVNQMVSLLIDGLVKPTT
ncbi:TetR/AcrR family transcriptional regulator [Polycladidibacter hongkongensis]|uniref:TetR/AcrR family transcriptional regulator n=1 Tax=Polycladidibacter hongkongensis TaxID=1647556 RepID=UPI000835F05A|nr:TetR/AcrR family transcriptional regulator [Pseudovibrio hongkongensis]